MGKRTAGVHAFQGKTALLASGTYNWKSKKNSKKNQRLQLISWQDPNYYHGPKAKPAVRRHHVMHSLQPLLKTISNLNEGVEKLEGEPRKQLFQGQPSEVRDCRPSSDKPCHPRRRKPCCRLGGSRACAGSTDLVMPSSQVTARSQPPGETPVRKAARVTLNLCVTSFCISTSFLKNRNKTSRGLFHATVHVPCSTGDGKKLR